MCEGDKWTTDWKIKLQVASIHWEVYNNSFGKVLSALARLAAVYSYSSDLIYSCRNKIISMSRKTFYRNVIVLLHKCGQTSCERWTQRWIMLSLIFGVIFVNINLINARGGESWCDIASCRRLGSHIACNNTGVSWTKFRLILILYYTKNSNEMQNFRSSIKHAWIQFKLFYHLNKSVIFSIIIILREMWLHRVVSSGFHQQVEWVDCVGIQQWQNLLSWIQSSAISDTMSAEAQVRRWQIS